jgi:hypothetical protein
MNKKPIENARDNDLRLSHQALMRAARRAHELAARTGTAIVIIENGVLKYIEPKPEEIAPRLHEDSAPYREK